MLNVFVLSCLLLYWNTFFSNLPRGHENRWTFVKDVTACLFVPRANTKCTNWYVLKRSNTKNDSIESKKRSSTYLFNYKQKKKMNLFLILRYSFGWGDRDVIRINDWFFFFFFLILPAMKLFVIIVNCQQNLYGFVLVLPRYFKAC